MSQFNDELKKLDPEFTERFDYFAFEQVPSSTTLDDQSRYLAILGCLLGLQGKEEFEAILPMALKSLTPVEIKEVVYQATAYLGIGRVYPFLEITNKVFKEQGIELSVEKQSTTTLDDRREKGTQAQVDIFGDHMKEAYKKATVNYFLASNCFGDYYTRTGLTLKQRELITFCYIAAQGGCEPQLKAHTQANLNMGNDKEFLMNVVLNLVPYMGYPRSLNAIACINEVCE